MKYIFYPIRYLSKITSVVKSALQEGHWVYFYFVEFINDILEKSIFMVFKDSSFWSFDNMIAEDVGTSIYYLFIKRLIKRFRWNYKIDMFYSNSFIQKS